MLAAAADNSGVITGQYQSLEKFLGGPSGPIIEFGSGHHHHLDAQKAQRKSQENDVRLAIGDTDECHVTAPQDPQLPPESSQRRNGFIDLPREELNLFGSPDVA